MRRLYLAESLTSSPRYARTMELRYHVYGECECGKWSLCLCGEHTHMRVHVVRMFTAMLSPDCQLRIMLNSNGNIFPPYLRVSYSSWTLNTESSTASLPVRRFSFFSFPSLSFLPPSSSLSYKSVHLSLHSGFI